MKQRIRWENKIDDMGKHKDNYETASANGTQETAESRNTNN